MLGSLHFSKIWRSYRILAKTLYVTFKMQIPRWFLQSSLLPFLYTVHNTPSVQLLGSVLVQACRITACNASTRLGRPFFNSSAAIEFAPAAWLFFRYFSAPFYFLAANQCQLHHLSNRLDVLVARSLL
jgi:hypothetical protein